MSRRVHCRFCDQTYVTDPGDCCGLCGKTGGLSEAAPEEILVDYTHRQSWAPSAGPNGATAWAAGCFGIVAGALIGVAVAFNVARDAPAQADQVVNLDAPAPAKCGLPVLADMFVRTAGGVLLGGAAGAILSILFVVVAARIDGRIPPESASRLRASVQQSLPAHDAIKKE